VRNKHGDKPRRDVSLKVLIVLLCSGVSVFGTHVIGRVYADTGRPVEGAYVTLQPTLVSAAGYAIYRDTTNAQGKFTVEVSEPGAYTICVGAPDRKLLNSCQWSVASSTIVIQTRQAEAGIKITLQSAIVLRIRLDDPDQLLPPLGKAAIGTVRFGVWGPDKHYHPAIEVSGDDKGRDFEILVPAGGDWPVSVQSDQVMVIDSNGRAAGTGPDAALSSRTADVGKVRRYRIVGKGK